MILKIFQNSLKEKIPKKVFLDEFWYLSRLFYCTPPGDCYCFIGKKFSTKKKENNGNSRSENKWQFHSKFHVKRKFLLIEFSQKMLYLCIFKLGFEKTFVIFKICTLEFPKMRSIMQRQKYLHLGQKWLFWVFLRWNLKKPLSYFKSTPSNSFKRKVSCENIDS